MDALEREVSIGHVEIAVPFRTRVVREERGRCFACRQRRVLYRIRVANGLAYDDTSALCAPCWGIR